METQKTLEKKNKQKEKLHVDEFNMYVCFL